MLYGPCDIEGHAGRDGRLYLLDFARVFPAEAPPLAHPPKGCHLYRLLRGELVRGWAQPLSSDAFSGFGRNNLAADKAVRSASQALLRQAVPAVAAALDREMMPGAPPLQLMQSLSGIFHRFQRKTGFFFFV